MVHSTESPSLRVQIPERRAHIGAFADSVRNLPQLLAYSADPIHNPAMLELGKRAIAENAPWIPLGIRSPFRGSPGRPIRSDVAERDERAIESLGAVTALWVAHVKHFKSSSILIDDSNPTASRFHEHYAERVTLENTRLGGEIYPLGKNGSLIAPMYGRFKGATRAFCEDTTALREAVILDLSQPDNPLRPMLEKVTYFGWQGLDLITQARNVVNRVHARVASAGARVGYNANNSTVAGIAP